MSKSSSAKDRRVAPLTTPTDLGANARRDISGAARGHIRALPEDQELPLAVVSATLSGISSQEA
jgi:hypothetical protein